MIMMKKHITARKWWNNNKDKINRRRRERYATDPSGKEKGRAHMKEFRATHPDYENEKKRARRKQCVEYLGGKCEICGLADNPISYDFHHNDPNEKDFALSGKALKYSWDRLKAELDKCQLLCAICHRKLHWT